MVLGEDSVMILDTAIDVSIVTGSVVLDLIYPVNASVVVLSNVNINALTTGEIPKHVVLAVGVPGHNTEDSL